MPVKICLPAVYKKKIRNNSHGYSFFLSLSLKNKNNKKTTFFFFYNSFCYDVVTRYIYLYHPYQRDCVLSFFPTSSFARSSVATGRSIFDFRFLSLSVFSLSVCVILDSIKHSGSISSQNTPSFRSLNHSYHDYITLSS